MVLGVEWQNREGTGREDWGKEGPLIAKRALFTEKENYA